MEDIKGIYKFTNLINNKCYVGQSDRLEQRYKQHMSSYRNENHGSYNTIFYRALRKYSMDNFSYEILIESDDYTREDLNELEIAYVESCKSFTEGYNMNKGGNFTSSTKTLKDEDVLKIKTLLKETNVSYTQIGKDFNVSTGLISMINDGYIWNSVGEIEFPIRTREKLLLNKGQSNPNAKIDNKKAMELRVEFMNKSLKEVHADNHELLSMSGMKKLLYGVTFQDLPIYKKREKKWYLNGTCIDYPRLEE